ncbi:two-component response regulator-like PRR95-like, partial [Trifolium medium]|nr:two-component response regulator-like PRR95-like [Trifolium medium]
RDGLKAWETLKNKSSEIDLVLTEVELPSISGFTLLTSIMELDNCKNIPVINMAIALGFILNFHGVMCSDVF